jgi:hypothetical protein
MVADDMPKGFVRGKSGLRRAGCRVIPGEGDFKDSATEINRQTGGYDLQLGKDGKVR